MNQAEYQNLANKVLSKVIQNNVLNQYFLQIDDFIDFLDFEIHEIDALFTVDDETFVKHIEQLAEKGIKKYNLQLNDFIELINYLAEEIFLMSQNINLPIETNRLTHLFSLLKSTLARVYFYFELNKIHNFLDDNSEEESLSPIKMHNTWFGKLAKHFTSNDQCPHEMDHLNCHCAHWLNAMEFELQSASYGEQQINQQAKIHLAHREVHAQGEQLLSFFKKGDFNLAYHHVKRLFEALLISQEFLRQMEMNFQQNPEMTFYQYVIDQHLLVKDLSFLITYNVKQTKLLQNDFKMSVIFDSKLQNTLKQTFISAGYDFIGINHSNSLKFLVKPLQEQSLEVTSQFCKTQLHDYLVEKLDNDDLSYQTTALSLDALQNQNPFTLSYFLKSLKHSTFDNAFHYLSVAEVKVMQAKADQLFERQTHILNLLNNQGLELFFQPIYRKRSTDKIFVETLVRAPYKEGLLSADDFLFIIEENELTTQLDLLVLKKLQSLLAQLTPAVNRVSVNVFPASFMDAEVIKQIQSLSIEAIAQGILLVVEITEQTAIKSINTLRKLKQKNSIVFAMDDFGSGYSNMLQLVEMAESGIISIIKIDGSLVKGIETSEKRFTLIKMLVEIAKTLNLQPVILEYVENQKTVDLLNTLSHDVLYQGFYFDKALPIKTLLEKYTPQ